MADKQLDKGTSVELSGEEVSGNGRGSAFETRTGDGEGQPTGRDAADVNWVEVFRTGSDIAAQVAAEEVLEDAGIPTERHDRRSHSVPAPASMAGEIGVAVPEEDAARARALLREAQGDGLLHDDGEVLEEAVV